MILITSPEFHHYTSTSMFVKVELQIMTKYKVGTFKMIPLSHERIIFLNSFVVVS